MPQLGFQDPLIWPSSSASASLLFCILINLCLKSLSYYYYIRAGIFYFPPCKMEENNFSKIFFEKKPPNHYCIYPQYGRVLVFQRFCERFIIHYISGPIYLQLLNKNNQFLLLFGLCDHKCLVNIKWLLVYQTITLELYV